MVGVAQLVEPWIVIPVVVGSSPIIHPICKPLLIRAGVFYCTLHHGKVKSKIFYHR